MKKEIKHSKKLKSISNVEGLLEEAAELSRIFPMPVARSLIKSGHTDINSVLELPEKSFAELLRQTELDRAEIEFQSQRFKRFKKLIETGGKPDHITGLSIDLPDQKILSSDELKRLNDSGVYNLSDWIEYRDEVEISQAGAKLLDQYSRLNSIKINGDLAKVFIDKGFDSASTIARLSHAQIKKIANQTSIKPDQIYKIVARAQDQSHQTLNFLNLIDIYSPDSQRPEWMDDIVIINPGLKCNPCSENESAFSCFAYYVYLVQKTELTLDLLQDTLNLDIDLKKLSPLAQDEMVDDPQAPCEQISVLKLIIRKLQDYLETRRNSADSLQDRQQYDFLDYASWRAERMADIYPELKALWQNDILTSIDIDEEQGSILMDRIEKRQHITEQIKLARDAIASAKVDPGISTVSDQKFNTLDNFTEEPFYQDYLDGFLILERILQADDFIQQATIDNQNYQSGLALANLNDALQLIDSISSEVFPDDSAWFHPDHPSPFNYKDLIGLPPARRKGILQSAFDDLMNGRKTVFEPTVKNLTLDGLTDEGEIDLNHAAWTTGSGITEGNSGLKIVPVSNSTERVVHYQRGNDDDEFDNYSLGFDFRTKTREKDLTHNFGIRIRTNNNPNKKHYIVKIIDAIEPGDQDDNETVQGGHYLAISKFDSLTGETPLGQSLIGYHSRSDIDGGGIRENHTYRLSASVSGSVIKAKLRATSTKIIELEATDNEIDTGSFSIVFPSEFDGTISNFEFSVEPGQGLPPFHASGRIGFPDGRPSMSLASDTYYRHQAKGHGMSEKLMPLPFVRKANENDKVKIHGVKRADKDLYMVFKAGSNKVKPNDINRTFERALAMLFYMRYAVIPIRMAQAYYQAGEFERAISLLQLLYDDTASANNDEDKQQIYPNFAVPPDLFNRSVSPDVRLLKLRLAEAYLAKAETLFRTDDQSNKYRARKLFQRVLDIHNSNCDCENRIGEITEDIIDRTLSVIPDPGRKPDHRYDPDLWAIIGSIYDRGQDIEKLKEIIQQNSPDDDVIDPPEHEKAIENIKNQIEQSLSKHEDRVATELVHEKIMQRGQKIMEKAELYTARQQARNSFLSNLSIIGRQNFNISTATGWIYGTFNYPAFCVPQNPLKSQQVKQACLMLKLLNNCLNILGFSDDFVPELRFEALVAIANDFAQKSHASERDLLNFRQLFEQESFSLMQAEQNLVLTDADVGLEKLNVEVAGGDRNIALLQSEQASAARQHYEDLIAAGLNDSEKFALMMAFASASFTGLETGVALAGSIGDAATSVANVARGGIPSMPGLPFGQLASFTSSLSNLYLMQAENERREENWKFNLQQNLFSEVIAQQNVIQAERRFAIAKTRQSIAELKRNFAVDAVQFLSNKFLNKAMYAWMIKTIREQYRTRLNYAIAASYMAERALAFEIQNQQLDVIRFDYFNPTKDGLLGATQLQTDLATLEQTHLRLSQRKLQLSKTLSLAQLFPVEFQQFKQSGILPFSTALGIWANSTTRSDGDYSLELFDRDFPGHYMRLIKSVKVSVIALVPPVDGIKATLRNSGISNAVIGPPYANKYQEITIRRQPDAIALSAPFNATGVFVLDYKDKFLLPFEGNGVATDWIFELPRASNNFNFETIFDVLVTIDYTSLESDDTLDSSGKTYEQQVIEKLGDEVSADRSYSLRYEFPDAWYHLNNPQSPLPQLEPMEIQIPVELNDFPANQEQLKIKRITFFAKLDDGTNDEINVTLKFNPDGTTIIDGGTIKTNQGLISKLNGNADNWDVFVNKPPFGNWSLKLRDENDISSFTKVHQLLSEEKIDDILFVISYAGKISH